MINIATTARLGSSGPRGRRSVQTSGIPQSINGNVHARKDLVDSRSYNGMIGPPLTTSPAHNSFALLEHGDRIPHSCSWNRPRTSVGMQMWAQIWEFVSTSARVRKSRDGQNDIVINSDWYAGLNGCSQSDLSVDLAIFHTFSCPY